MTIHYLELLLTLVEKEFKVRYKNTVLGFFWSIANPLLFALVLYFVFEHVLKNRTPNYLAFLLTGLFPWQCFATCTTSAPSMFIANAGLVKKVYFPRLLLPMATTLNYFLHLLIALTVGIPILAFCGFSPSIHWLYTVPILLVVQFGITFGVSLAISSLNVSTRDLEFLTMILVQLLFFLTPIMYSEGALPERMRLALHFNPMYYVITQWRNLLMNGYVDWGTLGVGGLVSFVVFLTGYGIYRRTERRLAELL